MQWNASSRGSTSTDDVVGAAGRIPGFLWEGHTLRPTGVVVFATLDRWRRQPDAGPAAGEPARSPVDAWRLRALRAMAWLLGR